MNPRIVVMGSVNMDLVVRAPRIPIPGETILGESLAEYPGGKGANQAVGAAMAGGQVAMVGCVGDDAFGRSLRASLDQAGVCTSHLAVRGPRSGVALIEVAASGENSIVVVPGANALLTHADAEDALAVMPDADILLLQLEIPMTAVDGAVRAAKARGMLVLLDPAPACPLSDALLSAVDILTPNQQEAALLAGMPAVGVADAPEAARRLLARGVGTVLVKLGADGVLIASGKTIEHVPGFSVATVDTTAAGDCMAGALAAALVAGRAPRDAVVFANAAAALSTTRQGGQTSMPTLDEIERFLAGPRD
ncbi:MAG TPA: ribokinase [Chloroflexota bacterium]|nr:ribokinase [Chloroflexota bacterium]